MKCGRCTAYNQLFNYMVSSIKTVLYLLSKEDMPVVSYILDSSLSTVLQLKELAEKEILPGD